MKLQRQWIQKVIGDQENRPRKKLSCFFRGRFFVVHFWGGESCFAAVLYAMYAPDRVGAKPCGYDTEIKAIPHSSRLTHTAVRHKKYRDTGRIQKRDKEDNSVCNTVVRKGRRRRLPLP